MTVAVRTDQGAAEVRALAKAAVTPEQARRLLAIALVLEGASRAAAARSSGMDRQTLRDWVHRFNAAGPDGLLDRKAPGRQRRLDPEQQRGPCQFDDMRAHRAIHHGRSRRKFGCLTPRGEGLGSKQAVGGGGDQVTAGGEGVGDSGVGSEEALGRAGRAEALQLTLASPDRDVRALGPIVLSLALDVLGAETQLSHRGTP